MQVSGLSNDSGQMLLTSTLQSWNRYWQPFEHHGAKCFSKSPTGFLHQSSTARIVLAAWDLL
jgi:hypothetical protein